ncbi:MAG: hypothetical protein WAV51_01435 [Microgenomates group bacterium]
MVKTRQKRTHRFFLGVLVGVFLLAIGGILAFFICTSQIPRGRLGIVLQGNPTMFVSWESDRSRFAIFLLPESMQIEAVQGYGWYGLDALWKLDLMDRHGGTVYKNSIQDALASPVRWYATGVNTADQVTDKGSAIGTIQHRLSFLNIFHMIVSGKTNIQPFEAWYVWNQIQQMGSDSMTLYDFQHGQLSSDITMPDETIIPRFDSAKYDALVGNTLEDTPFRQEGLRIALYNTTGTPGIAQKIARLIEHMGGFVVFVGNEEHPTMGNCEVTGENSMLSSRTAQFFRTFYGCSLHETLEGKGRADIIVRLGTGIEKQYMSK